MHPISGMHSLAVLYSYLGFFQGTPGEYETIQGMRPRILFSYSRVVGRDYPIAPSQTKADGEEWEMIRAR